MTDRHAEIAARADAIRRALGDLRDHAAFDEADQADAALDGLLAEISTAEWAVRYAHEELAEAKTEIKQLTEERDEAARQIAEWFSVDTNALARAEEGWADAVAALRQRDEALAEADNLLREATAFRTVDALHRRRVYFGGPDMRLHHKDCRLFGDGRLDCHPDCLAGVGRVDPAEEGE